MKCIAAIMIGMLGLLALTSPAMAHHKSGHDGGPATAWSAASHAGKKDDEKRQQRQSAEHQAGLHLGHAALGLSDDEADALADELSDCASPDSLLKMRLGRIKHLAHAAGLSNAELREVLDPDDERGAGWGRLWRDGLDSDAANDLEDALRGGLESGGLQAVPLGRIVQAAHACGLTPHELADLLRES